MTIGVAGTIHQIDILQRLEGQAIMNSFFVRCDNQVDSMEERVLRAIMECYIDLLLPVNGANHQLVMARGKEVSPALGAPYELGPLGTDVLQGAATGDTLPSHISLCVNLRGERGGNTGRGKFFIGGIPEAASQGSYIQTTNPYWTAILAFVTCLAGKLIHVNEPIGENQVSWVIMSRKLGGEKPPYALAGATTVLRATPRNVLGSSNSRKQGRGQ